MTLLSKIMDSLDCFFEIYEAKLERLNVIFPDRRTRGHFTLNGHSVVGCYSLKSSGLCSNSIYHADGLKKSSPGFSEQVKLVTKLLDHFIALSEL